MPYWTRVFWCSYGALQAYDLKWQHHRYSRILGEAVMHKAPQNTFLYLGLLPLCNWTPPPSLYAAVSRKCEYKLQFCWRSGVTPWVYSTSIHYWWKEINQFDVWEDVSSCRPCWWSGNLRQRYAGLRVFDTSCMYWLEIKGEDERLVQ